MRKNHLAVIGSIMMLSLALTGCNQKQNNQNTEVSGPSNLEAESTSTEATDSFADSDEITQSIDSVMNWTTQYCDDVVEKIKQAGTFQVDYSGMQFKDGSLEKLQWNSDAIDRINSFEFNPPQFTDLDKIKEYDQYLKLHLDASKWNDRLTGIKEEMDRIIALFSEAEL